MVQVFPHHARLDHFHTPDCTSKVPQVVASVSRLLWSICCSVERSFRDIWHCSIHTKSNHSIDQQIQPLLLKGVMFHPMGAISRSVPEALIQPYACKFFAQTAVKHHCCAQFNLPRSSLASAHRRIILSCAYRRRRRTRCPSQLHALRCLALQSQN